MHKILNSKVQRVVFCPVSTHTDHSTTGFVGCDHIRQLNARRFAVFVHVFVAGNVQIDVKLQQRDLFGLASGLHTRNSVNGGANLVLCDARTVRGHLDIDVFTRINTLFKLV